MGPDVGQLLHQHCVEEEIATGAAVLLGRAGAQEALLAAAPPGVAIGRPPGVPVGDLGGDLGLGEAPELGAEELVLLAEDVASHGGPPRASTPSIREFRSGALLRRRPPATACA